MVIVERSVGRLVEVQCGWPISAEEILFAQADIAEHGKAVPPPGLVICADLRRLRILSDERSGDLLGMFRHDNSHIICSGLLISPDSAVASLQMERMIREAQHPMRKCFRDPAAMREWLDPHLTPPERARVRVFLGSASERPPSTIR